MKFESFTKETDECPDCHNTGIVKDPDGQIHTCWKCLESGRLDAHSKNLPDTDIKL